MTTCPFCDCDPFEYVNVGDGMVAAAVTCCEYGDLYFRGARGPLTRDVAMDPDEFHSVGLKIDDLRQQIYRRDRIISKLLGRRRFRAQIDNRQ